MPQYRPLLSPNDAQRNELAIVPKYDTNTRRRHKDRLTRYNNYLNWLIERGQRWFAPDLLAYSRYLEETYQPYTASLYEATVRSRYQELLEDKAKLQELAQDEYATGDVSEPWEIFWTNVQAAVTQAAERPAKRKPAKRPPRAGHRSLTREQVEQLLAKPDPTTLPGLRDLAVLAFMVCTGLRDGEVSAIQVKDVFEQTADGQPALYVRDGVGRVERFVVYGDTTWMLQIVQRWFYAARITSGPAFRGFKRDGSVRATGLSEQAVRDILKSYPIEIDGELVTVKPLDIRYTYARHLYESGVDLTIIQQNLGFGSAVTLLDYIDVQSPRQGQPAPPALYHYDLSRLNAPHGKPNS